MVKRPSRLLKLVREYQSVLMSIIAYSDVVLHVFGGVVVDHLGEVFDERNLARGINASEVESAILRLLFVGERSDDRVSGEQRDQAE